MSYVIQALHPTGENFHYQRTLMTLHTIRENPRNPWLKNLCSLPATADSRMKSSRRNSLHHSLPAPNEGGETPYWSFKHASWKEAKRKAEELETADAITMPTPNGSFDPADYILPKAAGDSTPYQLLLAINQPC
jgi:hypothetical protein